MRWENILAQYGTYFTLVILPPGSGLPLATLSFLCSCMSAWIVAFGLHASQVLKTSDNGIQLADRASAVLYVAVSAALAVFIVQFWPTRQLHWYHTCYDYRYHYAPVYGWIYFVRRFWIWLTTQPLRGWSQMRAPLMQRASRLRHGRILYLGSNNHMGTDRTNQLLMATFGNQRIIDTIADHIDVCTDFL